MGKTITFMIIALVILASGLQIAEAHRFSPDGREYVIDFDDGIYSRDYAYVDWYGQPLYKVYEHPRNYDDGELSYYEKLRSARFLIDSYDYRYYVSAGKTSGEAFGGDDKPAVSSTNFRYKAAYDPWADGVDRKNDYYYKPVFDYQSQTFNWRF